MIEMIKSIVRKELQVMRKEKGMYFWMFVMPILFIVLFGSVFGSLGNSTVTIHYVDQDQSAASKQFLQVIGDIKGFDVQQDATLTVDEQVAKIRDGKLSSLLVLPKGFEDSLKAGSGQAKLVLYRDATADAEVAPVQAVLQNIAGSYRDQKVSAALAAAGKSEAEIKQVLLPPVQIAEEKENAARVNMISQIVPGYTVMFVFFIMISMIKQFNRDRESGMIARLRSTPMRPLSYLIGMWIPNIVVVLVQCTVLLGFGHFMYDLDLGDLTSIVVLIALLAVCGTGFGLAMSMIVKSEQAGLGFTQLITMGGAVLGGLWFPIDRMPTFVQVLGHIMPQFWAQKGLQDVIVRGAHLGSILPSVAVLAGFAVLALCIALLRFKRFLKTAVN